MGSESTSGNPSSADEAGSGSVDESGSVDGGSTSGGEPADACAFDASDYGTYPMAAVFQNELVVEEVCNFPALVGNGDADRLELEGEDFPVWIYRPDDNGSWPGEPAHPVVFFVPGNDQFLFAQNTTPTGLDDHYYGPLFEELVADGHVVIAAQPFTANISSGKRTRMLACMMLWAADSTNGWAEADADRIRPAATLMGHSRGGAGAWLLTDSFQGFQQSMIAMADYELCATVGISQRWASGTPGIGDPTHTNTRIVDPEHAVPFLAIQGAAEEDTVGQSISAFDALVPDDNLVGGDLTTFDPFDKLHLWVYGPQHNDWGGVPQISTPGRLIANETGPFYVASFLRWKLFGAADARDALMVPLNYDTQASDFPAQNPDIVDPSLWDGFYQYDDTGQRPLVYGDYTQGILENGSR